ncbi:MAG: hypothetical protein QXJ28_01480, partial [Candidatus Pacearchaeota archaeon]
TLVFAILQKSKILGEDKKQIDALVSLSIAMMVIGFSWATGIISRLMPFLAISVTVLLVFFILFGFVASVNDKGLEIPKQLKIGFGVLAGIVTIVALIIATGQWDNVYGYFFKGGSPTNLSSNILIIAIIIGALIVALTSGKKSSK